MVVELKIDGHKVDMNQKGNIAATHSIADIEEPDSTAVGYTKSVEVPLISNMRVFDLSMSCIVKSSSTTNCIKRSISWTGIPSCRV